MTEPGGNMTEPIQRIKASLKRIYGESEGAAALGKILPLIQRFNACEKEPGEPLTEKDTVLICYGDSLVRTGEMPLRTLHTFAKDHLKDIVSTLHILPFFPYSSDDGFSVTDYATVRHDLGTWEDIQAISEDFKLMFDLVLNHVSAESGWFRQYLQQNPGFRHLAIEVDPSMDLRRVVRPRSLPLLTDFIKESGEMVHLWTTFSADQIDLNFKDPDVLVLMVETLLLYVEKGASVIRLDAIAYLWKEIGTSCIHLPQTHETVKLLRAILDMVAPWTLLLTETNVPHAENISYFGKGNDEAQLVYNFTLPPLVLYAFVKGDATPLTEWAGELPRFSGTNAFFNFTASHDGIGVRPLEGILQPSAVGELMDHILHHAGRVSFKQNPDGSESPYELNITYVDALAAKGSAGDFHHAKRFLASQAIPLVFPGVPAGYIHSLLGSRNWLEGVEKTGRARSINRESLPVDALARQLRNPESFRSRIFYPYTAMIRTRSAQPAFHPNAAWEVLDLNSRIFGLVRTAENQRIYTITNVSSDALSVSISAPDTPPRLRDLLTGRICSSTSIQLEPFQYVWLSEA